MLDVGGWGSLLLAAKVPGEKVRLLVFLPGRLHRLLCFGARERRGGWRPFVSCTSRGGLDDTSLVPRKCRSRDESVTGSHVQTLPFAIIITTNSSRPVVSLPPNSHRN